MNDHANMWETHPKSRCQFLIGEIPFGIEPPNLCYLNGIQLLTVRGSVPGHVDHIFLLGSQSQMHGVAATAVADARMQHPQFRRHVSIVLEHPRHFRSSNRCVAPDSYQAIPVLICGSGPVPAVIGLSPRNSKPKAEPKRGSKDLPENFRRSRLVPHNQDSFGCATAPAAETARGHFFFDLPPQQRQP